jgi:O-antigen ligase
MLETVKNKNPIKFFCLTSLSAAGAAHFLLQGNYIMAATSAGLPLLAIFSMEFASRPFLCIIGIAVSYMLNLNITKWGLTTNIFFVAICFFSVLAGREDFRFQAGKKFLFFLCLFIGYALFSYFLTHKQINYYDINLYINNIVILLLFFLLDTEYKIELLYKSVVICALILFASGIYQLIQFGGMPYGYMTGYYSNHVVYALHMAWGVPLSFYLYRKYKNIFYLIACVLLMAGLLLAFSRGVLLAFVMSIITYISIKYIYKSPHKKTFYLLYFLVGIMIAAAVYGHLIKKGHYGSDINEVTSGRSVLYRAAWKSFLDHPVTGVGWENYKSRWMYYVNIPRPEYGSAITDKRLNTHSSYLKILSELGIIGIALYLIFNFYLLKDTWSILLSKPGFPLLIILLIYFFHGIVDNNSYGNERMFYFAAGILFSLKTLKRETFLG